MHVEGEGGKAGPLEADVEDEVEEEEGLEELRTCQT